MRISDWSSDVCSSDLEALVRRDSDLAQKVVAGDEAIDQMDVELDDNAVRTLALRQPMANDLREVIAALKISSDIERIRDYAQHVAKRTIALNQLPQHESALSSPPMANLVPATIQDVPDAFVNLHPPPTTQQPPRTH